MLTNIQYMGEKEIERGENEGYRIKRGVENREKMQKKDGRKLSKGRRKRGEVNGRY